MLRTKNKNIIISYLSYRKLIGILGILLPFICMLGGFIFAGLSIQHSISFYYHTNMREFFVGLLFCMSMFLIAYNGYNRIDLIVTTLSGIAGFGVAVFPELNIYNPEELAGIFQMDAGISDIIHATCAVIFFILLAVNSIFLFTLTDKSKKVTRNKKIRNGIYIGCGIVILLSLLLIGVFIFAMGLEYIQQNKICFLLETIMLVAFGISWLVKGGTLFRDRIKE